MRVELDALTKAVYKVKGFADSNSAQVPGVLLDIGDNTLSICYAENRKAIIEKISIDQSDDYEKVNDKVVVPYARLVSVIDMCQPDGEIKTGDIDLQFFGKDKVMLVSADKYMIVQRLVQDEADVDNEEIAMTLGDGIEVSEEPSEPVYREEAKVVSQIKQRISYEHPEDSIRYGVLTRMNYASIFEDANGNSDVDADFDVWGREELRNTLSRLATEKGKTIYLSSQLSGAFVSNMAYLNFVPIDESVSHGFSIATSTAKALVDILGKISDEKVRVTTAERYVKIINGTDTVGIWFEMTPASKTDIGTLNSYKEKGYDSHQLVFSRAALNNAVKCAQSATKDEKTTIGFVDKDGEAFLHIAINNSGASISGDFDVVIEGRGEIPNWEELSNTKLPISLKVLNEMLNDCTTTYIAFDIESGANGKFIRLSELFGRDESGEKMLGTMHYTVVGK